MPSSTDPNARVSSTGNAVLEREQSWSQYLFQVQTRDSTALSQLYDESSGLVFSVALRILENRDDAEEVTLDVYTQVWNQAASWDASRGSVTAWLVLLARSRALDRARRRRSRAPAVAPDSDWRRIACEAQSPEEVLAVQQRRERIQKVLGRLPEPQRHVLDLAFFGGLTQQAIADHLGEPLGTVKSRIRSAMLRLKDLLLAEEEELEGWMQ